MQLVEIADRRRRLVLGGGDRLGRQRPGGLGQGAGQVPTTAEGAGQFNRLRCGQAVEIEEVASGEGAAVNSELHIPVGERVPEFLRFNGGRVVKEHVDDLPRCLPVARLGSR